MKVLREEVETFAYKEFVEIYIQKILRIKKTHYMNILIEIIRDTPKSFFDFVESKKILSSKFKEQIRESYGDLWVSNVGNIDVKIIYEELKKVIKKTTAYDNDKADEIIYYIFVEIIQCNPKYGKNLRTLYERTENVFPAIVEINPIPLAYRDLSIYLKEYSGKEDVYIQEETNTLEELFTAAETIITDDIGLNIIKSIKEIVHKK